MNKLQKLILIPVLLTGLIIMMALPSCSNNGCEETRESYCLATLSSVSGATLSRVSAWGIGRLSADSTKGDSIMIDGESSPTELTFILNPDSSVCQVRLQMTGSYYNDAYQYDDTLTFEYQAYPYFIDMECECSVRFALKSVTSTGHFIRAILINNKEITNEENVNITIQY